MKRKYRGYPEYQGSRVAWMGDVPDHWEPVRFKQVLAEKKKNCNPELSAGSISFGNVIYKSSENLLPETKASYQEVLAGEFLINPLNMNYDLLSLRTALSSIDVVVSTGYIVLQSNGRLLKRYTRWLLQEFDVAHMKTLGSGVRQTISYADIGNSFFFEPSKEEQENIANFLDHETAKIDILIEKQQQLIKLLKEKRQAVISHAVTKGLNPNAPMCDSGVEWLGEVPEHWAITRFKFVCDRIIAGPFGSSVTKDMYVKRGYKVYGQEQVIPNDFMVGDYYISEKDYTNFSRYVVSSGDVLISCVGTFGMIAVFPEEAEPGIINPRLIKAEVNSSHSPYYIREFLKSETVFKQFELLSRGGTMGVINIAILSEIVVAVPALDEQNEIITYINNEKLKYRTLIEHADRAVNLLQERRTALISAAVTGKIDIRDWEAPEQPTNKEAAA